ncbi:MAG: Tol-Pal system beta propeller repeat protein TolB [Thermodesulfovibrionales bacterium]|nr:Tol-Pal system beta propeller repeat protein TolB [Thermodesulfovibrionales bacterium]
MKKNRSRKSEVREKITETRSQPKQNLRLSVFCVLCSVFCLLYSVHAEKVYIDITSPGIKKLPIAVQNFTDGKEISDIVKDDLTFTGLFECIEDAAQIESPEQPFNINNWKGLGVELVAKGKVKKDKDLIVTVFIYDVSEGREIMRKEYTAAAELLRSVSHSIANDIYKILTGHQGIFKTKIAFVGENGGKKEIQLMDLDGHRMYSLGITGGILLTPRWSTDGAKLLYSAERTRIWAVYLFDLNTLKEKNASMLKGLNISGNFFPNNKEFVFTASKNGKSNIYISDIVSMKSRELISSPWIDISPSVSPDGNHVLFVSNRSGSPQIYIADKDGEGIKRLTFDGSYNTSPVWSPKGDRIAFVRMIGGKNQIFIMKPDGRDITQLTNRGSNEEPSFSPDGRYIAFTSDRNGTKGIYLMRLNGEGQTLITPKGFKATSPGWSPL